MPSAAQITPEPHMEGVGGLDRLGGDKEAEQRQGARGPPISPISPPQSDFGCDTVCIPHPQHKRRTPGLLSEQRPDAVAPRAREHRANSQPSDRSPSGGRIDAINSLMHSPSTARPPVPRSHSPRTRVVRGREAGKSLKIDGFARVPRSRAARRRDHLSHLNSQSRCVHLRAPRRYSRAAPTRFAQHAAIGNSS